MAHWSCRSGLREMPAARERRYTRPILLEKGKRVPQRLPRVGFRQGVDAFSEDWLQSLLFEQPDLLPIVQIEPAFADAVPVCREMPTPAGPIDLVLVTEDGLPVLVETKLWRNPEARRIAVVQILDYAKEIASWSADDFDRAVRLATRNNRSVFDIVAEHRDEPDEPLFYDGLERNLRDGRFLLLIVGDGIREGVESMTDFLQSQVGLGLTFGLVELGVYKVPAMDGALLIQPQVLARTVEIERAVIRRTSADIDIANPESDAGKRPESLTEEAFFEALAQADRTVPSRLRTFFRACEDRLGLYITVSKASLILHWYDDLVGKVNFGTFFPDGRLRTNYLCHDAAEWGDVSIGTDYLKTLSAWCDGSTVRREGKPWTWKVVKDGRDPPMAAFLEHAEDWLKLLDNSMNRFRTLAEV